MPSRRGDAAFETYLQEIRQYPLLTAEQEKALARRIQRMHASDGTHEEWVDAYAALSAMVEANLRLVVSVAKRYVGRGLTLPDLVEEGNLGLVHAAKKFDPDQDTRFSTYATWWIKQAVRRSLMNTVKTVRVPSYLAEEVNRWRGFAREFESRNGRPPQDDELLQALKPQPGRRRLLLRLFHSAAPGSATVSLDTLFETVDAVVDPRAERPDLIDLGDWEREGLLARLSSLPEREAEVLRLRFGLSTGFPPLTLREIGRRLSLSRERVRQLEQGALERLRAGLDRKAAAPAAAPAGASASAPARPGPVERRGAQGAAPKARAPARKRAPKGPPA